MVISLSGQVLISGDMLGYFEAFTPKFVKKYVNVARIMTEAIFEYTKDIRGKKFPGIEHTYSVLPEEKEKFSGMIEKYKK